jgi:hypothetical protein
LGYKKKKYKETEDAKSWSFEVNEYIVAPNSKNRDIYDWYSKTCRFKRKRSINYR